MIIIGKLVKALSLFGHGTNLGPNNIGSVGMLVPRPSASCAIKLQITTDFRILKTYTTLYFLYAST